MAEYATGTRAIYADANIRFFRESYHRSRPFEEIRRMDNRVTSTGDWTALRQ